MTSLPSTPLRKAGPGVDCVPTADTVTDSGSRKKNISDDFLLNLRDAQRATDGELWRPGWPLRHLQHFISK
jgi:hypothetical protein